MKHKLVRKRATETRISQLSLKPRKMLLMTATVQDPKYLLTVENQPKISILLLKIEQEINQHLKKRLIGSQGHLVVVAIALDRGTVRENTDQIGSDDHLMEIVEDREIMTVTAIGNVIESDGGEGTRVIVIGIETEIEIVEITLAKVTGDAIETVTQPTGEEEVEIERETVGTDLPCREESSTVVKTLGPGLDRTILLEVEMAHRQIIEEAHDRETSDLLVLQTAITVDHHQVDKDHPRDTTMSSVGVLKERGVRVATMITGEAGVDL